MPKPVERPSRIQLVAWARANGTLSRIAPNETVPTRKTMFLLRGIYAASLHQWRQKGGQVVRPSQVQINISLRQRLSAIFAVIPQPKRPARK
jgi:hypothetical protein